MSYYTNLLSCSGVLFFYLGTCCIYHAELGLMYMVFYWPAFSLMFLVHLFVSAGVYGR